MGKTFRGLLWIAAILGLLGLLIRTVFLEVWVLPDEPKLNASVAPSLAGGDMILYMRRNHPAFGDLVRCTDPDDPTRFVVGRVAGLTGDLVESDGADLRVNGKRFLSEMGCTERTVQVVHPSSGQSIDLTCDMVQMAGHPHARGVASKAAVYSPTKTQVGGEMLFLLSDDRSYHDDSRDFGTVRADTCTGRIVFRLVSKGGWGDEKHRLAFIQ